MAGNVSVIPAITFQIMGQTWPRNDGRVTIFKEGVDSKQHAEGITKGSSFSAI